MRETKDILPGSSHGCDSTVAGSNVVSIGTRGTEVVIHINNTLGHAERCYVEEQLRSTTGILAAQYCDCHPHLLVVTYDANQLASIEVLDHLRQQGLAAQLIGPI
jgi:hypothetical protein